MYQTDCFIALGSNLGNSIYNLACAIKELRKFKGKHSQKIKVVADRDLNSGHADFQSAALPTELSRPTKNREVYENHAMGQQCSLKTFN